MLKIGLRDEGICKQSVRPVWRCDDPDLVGVRLHKFPKPARQNDPVKSKTSARTQGAQGL